MRIGPSFEYAVEWLYQAPGLPLEITEEYGNWRQVRDCDGISGWMHQSLLSSKRTVIVGPWLKNMTALRAQAQETSFVKAELEARVRVESCRAHSPGATSPSTRIISVASSKSRRFGAPIPKRSSNDVYSIYADAARSEAVASLYLKGTTSLSRRCHKLAQSFRPEPGIVDDTDWTGGPLTQQQHIMDCGLKRHLVLADPPTFRGDNANYFLRRPPHQ
jgi:hypothetical protein